LGARSPADTRRAFNAVNNCWIAFSNAFSITNNDYLKRRNFDPWPWLVHGFPIGPMPPSAAPVIPSVGAYYDFKITLGRTIPKSTFPTEVAAIRTDAARRYGPNYDKLVCP